MSTEQSYDPQLIEQTKQQIRGLVNEIAQLTKSDMAPEQFYGEFLTRVVTALAAVGGAVWATSEEGRLALQFQVNLAEARLGDREEDQKRHGRLLYRVMRSGEGALMPPHSGMGDESEEGNPSDYLLILGPLKTDLETVGVVEVIQRPEAGPSTQKGYLRFLLQMCDLAADYLKTRQLRSFSNRQALWTQLEDFTHMIHASLEPRETAYTVANESRRLIGCDRVSVAIRKGNKCYIEAISGQDLFDKRSNTVRLLSHLATEVVAAGDPIWYTGDTSDLAPQVEDAMQEYIDEAHSKMVAVLPLRRPTPEHEKESDDKPDEELPFGALIVEQIEDSELAETTVNRVNVVMRHTSTALGNAMEYRNLFLMPVWRAIGKSRWLVRARTLPKTISISCAVLASILALIFVPADFELQAKGTLEPVNRRDVFAQIEGKVEELSADGAKVDHGFRARKGQVLGRLHNTELDMQITEVTGQRLTTRQEIASIQRQLLEERERNRMTPEQHIQLAGKLLELKKSLESLDAKWELCQKKKEDLKIVSPADGTVITWDLYNRLIERPVKRGDVLMRIGEVDGNWQGELHMSEDRMGFITKSQHELGPDLRVTYILASEPGTKRVGQVKEIQESAEVRGEEGSTVLIKVKVDKDELPPLRPGTNITAKVYCGRRAIGYVWFHDLVAFIQSRVLFRL